MPTQTSNLRQYYSQFSYNAKKILNEYKKDINQNVFFLNIDALRTEADLIEFKIQRWTYRPMMFCNEIYSEPNFAPVIMTVNNINSFFDFKEENFYSGVVISPPREVILRVLSYVSDIL